MQVTNAGTTTTTAYIDNVEEVQTGGSGTQTTTSYFAGDQRIAEAINGVFSYLGSDRLGSPVIALSSTGAIIATQLYSPYGSSRYKSGTMPGSIGFTGQHADDPTGLDYFVSRYYDPSLGAFISPDSALPANGYNPWGLSRYTYVQGNPETATDPDGHCWPLCTMIIGAVVGAVVGAAVSVGTQAVSGHCCNWGEVGKQAAVGAVSGAISGLAGPEAGLAVHAAIGAASGAAGQMVSNLIDHKPIGDGVLEAAAIGGLTGVAAEGAGAVLKKAVSAAKDAFGTAAEDAEKGLANAAEACGLSFSADTLVATPNGEQPIGSLNVGDHVQAYDPATKKVSTQTVQRVFINHDTDLIDVTLQVNTRSAGAAQAKQQQVAVKSHGSQAPPQGGTETTVHTTQKHPWLTTKGWIPAGQLHLGDQVQQLDGTTATVVALSIVPGAASMWDLTVSNVHTFAVDSGQFIVHNNGCVGDKLPARVKGDPTQGVLVAGNDQTDLISGIKGPGKNMASNIPGFSRIMQLWTHVEGHAAALMRLGNIKEATLYLNNTPCSGILGCGLNLPHLLPEGSTLTVIYKDAEKGINDWTTASFTGLPDSEWTNSAAYKQIQRYIH